MSEFERNQISARIQVLKERLQGLANVAGTFAEIGRQAIENQLIELGRRLRNAGHVIF